MEDLPTITDAEQASFCVELTKRLNIQRKQGQLCDMTLVTNDDKELKAHRNVLSAASPFFCKLLQSDMKENREGIVRFEEISGSVMEDVLEFIYTGTVEVTEENSEELVAAANYLLISNLKAISGRFLEQKMSNSNCISTFYLAEKYQCDELFTKSRNFIHANFASVAAMDEFLNLEAKEVGRWFSSDEISVTAEADLFKIMLKWVEQNRSEPKTVLEELFRHVRLDFLSRDYLIDVVTNELVQQNFVCLKMALDALKKASYSVEDDQSQSPRKGLETDAIVACGGKFSFCYLPEKDNWKRLADGLSSKTKTTKMIKFRGQLYAFPHHGSAERFDPVFNGWSTLDLSANSATVAVVRGEIYAIEVNYREQTVVKKYKVEQCAWETVLSSHEGCRNEACVVAAGSHLYVFGGMPPRESKYVAKAERFDTVENKWEEIKDMQEERGGAFGVAIQEKIFVAGGKYNFRVARRQRQEILKTCEMYNISTNEWQLVASLNVSRMYGTMVSLNRKLYVLGGTSPYNERELGVECFDPAKDKWSQKTTIPVANIDTENTFTGCVLRLSRGVLDKLNVAGE